MSKGSRQFSRSVWCPAAFLAAVLAGLALLVWSLAPARADPVHVQEAADGAALKGTWVMVDYQGSSPVTDILVRVNTTAQDYGIPDTNGNPDDIVNDNVLAFFVFFDGSCVPMGTQCWELHQGPNLIPAGARGLRVEVTLPITGASIDLAGPLAVVTATATAVYAPDGGILPIAVNEYWLGSQGNCPYQNCGLPYSFVRDPAQLPPFYLVSSSPEEWARNTCPDPFNEDTCQGPYDGAGENLGQAFALLGGDAKPNDGSMNPRGGVMLDCRYNSLVGNIGTWWYLLADDQWSGPGIECPMNDGEAADVMAEVILAGGYEKVPLPRSVHEPPPDYYIDDWAYCWGTPSPDNCFNYPETGRSAPYDTLQFLNGAKTAFIPPMMYDNGDYLDGRYAPGEHIVVTVYNSVAGNAWGYPLGADTAVIVGYAGVTIVGYGSTLSDPCNGTPGDWESYASCVQGTATTVYGLVYEEPLVLDPTGLINEWLPKRVMLITPTVTLPVVASAPAQANAAPYPPHRPAPFDMAMGVPLTATLSWQGGDPDSGPVTYTVAFGTGDPPPVVASGWVTPTYDPGPLLLDTTYYWAITATDGLSTTAGLVWQFTTAEPVVVEYRFYLPLVLR